MDQNIAVETVLLAHMVNKPGVYSQLAHYPAEVFYDADHQHWFDAIRDCYSETGQCDSIAIRTRMLNEGHEGAFIAKFDQIVMSPALGTSLEPHVDALLDSYHLRKLKAFAADVMQTRTAEEAQEIMTRAVNETLADRGDAGESIDSLAAREGVLSTVGRITPTGFLGLDKIIRGFGDTDLICIGGHAKQGKTTFAEQIALDMSRTDWTNYYSLEMPREELIQKAVCRKAHVDYNRLTSGQMSAEERERVKTTLEVFRSGAYKFKIFDGYMHIDEILAHAKIDVMQNNIKRIVIDYIQLCEATRERGMSRYEVVGTITRKMKQFAVKNRCSVIALSQFNGDKNEKPGLQSFRESGNIGQDCNIGIAVWYDPADKQNKLILMPGRRCPDAEIMVDFRGAYSEFVDRSVERVPDWRDCEKP